MNFNKSVLFGVILAGSAAMPFSVFAGGYIGASIGEAGYSAPAFGPGSIDLDSFSLEAGYSFSENFSLDVSYQDLGSLSDGETSLALDGFTLAVAGTLPLNDAFSLTASLGTFLWDIEAADLFNEASADGSDMFYSVGASYAATESVDLTLGFAFYDLESVIDIDTVSIGASYNF